jgi:hypothetical protein
LHGHGKFVHIHVDGYAKPLLPLLKLSGLDGVEALTPKPAGDFTLEEMKAALGDEMVVLDGIPTRSSSRTRASRNPTGSSPGSLSCSGAG